MAKRKPAPADRPSTMKAPDYRKEKVAKERAEEQEWAAKCGPVTVRKVTGTRVGEWGGD